MIIAYLVLTGRWNVLDRFPHNPGEFVGSAVLAAVEVFAEILMFAGICGVGVFA